MTDRERRAEGEKDSLIIAMRLLLEDLKHNGNVMNANPNEEIEQRSPQMTNSIQQANEVSNEFVNPSTQRSNRFSALSVDENAVNEYPG